jgi:hypothetical protein
MSAKTSRLYGAQEARHMAFDSDFFTEYSDKPTKPKKESFNSTNKRTFGNKSSKGVTNNIFGTHKIVNTEFRIPRKKDHQINDESEMSASSSSDHAECLDKFLNQYKPNHAPCSAAAKEKASNHKESTEKLIKKYAISSSSSSEDDGNDEDDGSRKNKFEKDQLLSFHANKLKECNKQIEETNSREKRTSLLKFSDSSDNDDDDDDDVKLVSKIPCLMPQERKKVIYEDLEASSSSEREDDVIEIGGSDKSATRKKIEFNKKTIEKNDLIEKKLEQIDNLNELTDEQIEYMVLRDINYFLYIFSGQCEHSWRHTQYKKNSARIGNMLCSKTLLACFREEQYMAAVRAFKSVFCQNHNRRDDYIVKVLLPESLIKICMRIHQCSKVKAEVFLEGTSKVTFKQFNKEN